jgi:hypothetical protein
MGGDHLGIQVPNDCSVGDVLKKALEHSGVKVNDVSFWYSDIELNCDHLFADYFEPDGVYQVNVGGNIPEGTLLCANDTALGALGVNLIAPELLLEVDELEWSMDEFPEKAGDFAPTLVVIKMKNGTECGGVAEVPWPKPLVKAADPAKGSLIFSLGATPARFDLVNPELALYCSSAGFVFGYGSADLFVWGNGDDCGSDSEASYAGPREKGQLIGGTTEDYFQPYERWELWRL